MNLWECDRCDGFGTYEGGETLETKCEICDGVGVVDKDNEMTPEQIAHVLQDDFRESE